MRFIFYILFLLCLFPGSLTYAQDRFVIKDSIYFTLDDGIMSPEEMEEEAAYLHDLCLSNAYQNTYFDCACLAGAFLQKREKLGPLTPQGDIMEELLRSENAVCPNTSAIAGRNYMDCLEYARNFREYERDKEQYCTCAANKMARDFARAPRFEIPYIRRLKSNSFSYCANPQNQKSRAAINQP